MELQLEPIGKGLEEPDLAGPLHQHHQEPVHRLIRPFANLQPNFERRALRSLSHGSHLHQCPTPKHRGQLANRQLPCYTIQLPPLCTSRGLVPPRPHPSI
jgi:hypothetical protein